MITIQHYSGQALQITQRDLLSFERKIAAAARSGDEREISVVNPARGYILFANVWRDDVDGRTPAEIASGEIALVLDGVANIGQL